VELSNTALCRTLFTLSVMQSVASPPQYAQHLFTTHKPRPHKLWQSERQASKKVYLSLNALYPSNSLTDLWRTKHETQGKKGREC